VTELPVKDMRAAARADFGDSESPEFIAAWAREADRAEAEAGMKLRFCETNGGSSWAATADAIAGGLLFESGGVDDLERAFAAWESAHPGERLYNIDAVTDALYARHPGLFAADGEDEYDEEERSPEAEFAVLSVPAPVTVWFPA